jgi:non-specific serine/threonine protein kinase/serine/threonine-protein kinase
MAMRKEPQRRYKTAEQFAEDLQRHLDGMPVIARRDTVGYRTLKFVRRNRVGVAAAAVIILLLLGGISGTSWQAAVADQERDRAEARFQQVRDLAQIFMFDFHDRIKKLDGATPAQELLVTTALSYLDGLSQDVGDDAELKRDLATGYDRVGDILGGRRGSSLGRIPEALEKYRKGLVLREELLDEMPGDLDLRKELAASHLHVGDMLKSMGDLDGALAAYREEEQLARSLAQADLRYRRTLALALQNVGGIISKVGDLDEALRIYRESLDLREALVHDQRNDTTARRDLSGGLMRVGEVLEAQGDVSGALDKYLEAIRHREWILQQEPKTGRAHRDLGIAHYVAGLAQLSLNQVEDAKLHLDRFLEIALERERANPGIPRDALNLAVAYEARGMWRAAANDLDGAMESYREFQSIIVPLADEYPSNTYYHRYVGNGHQRMAEVLVNQGKLADALAAYAEALVILEGLTAEEADDIPLQVAKARVLSATGDLLMKRNDLIVARQKLNEARSLLIALLERQPKRTETRHELALALYRLSMATRRGGDDDGATTLAEDGLDLLKDAQPGLRTNETRLLLQEALGEDRP